MSVSGREKPAAEEAMVAGSVSCGTNGHQSFLARDSAGIKLQERRVAVVSSHCFSRVVVRGGNGLWMKRDVLYKHSCCGTNFSSWQKQDIGRAPSAADPPEICGKSLLRDRLCIGIAFLATIQLGWQCIYLHPKEKIGFLEELSTFFPLQWSHLLMI